MRSRIFAGVIAASLAWSAASYAQDTAVADPAAEARAQYQLGTQAFQAKKYSEAALHFESAASFRPHAVALYTAALAWDLANNPPRAADAYSRALDVPGLDAKQTSTAKDRITALEKMLGTVVVTAPEGWKVQLDAFTEAPVPARLHGPSGAHQLSVRAPGKPIDHRDVTLETGKITPLELKDEPTKPPPTTTPNDDKTSSTPQPTQKDTTPPRLRESSYWTTRRVAGVGVAGLGVAALGAGIILGLEANSAGDAYNAAPSREGFDHASSLETWTNVMLIGGAVVLVGGIVLVVLPDSDGGEARLKMGLGPRGATLGGAF